MTATLGGWVARTLSQLLAVVLVATSLTLIAPGPAVAQTVITAADDRATVEPGRSVLIDVLSNDEGLDDRDVLTVFDIPVPPATGQAFVNSDNAAITYNAPLDFTGASFEYQIHNSTGLTATATVTLDLESSCSDFTLTEADGADGIENAILSANRCIGAQTIFLGPGRYVTSLDFSPIEDQLSIVALDPTNRPEILNASATTFPVTFRVATGVSFEARSLVFRDLDSITTFIDAATGAAVVADDLLMVGSTDPKTSNGVAAIHGSGATLDVRNTTITDSDGSGIVGVNGSSLVGENLVISGSGNSGIAVFNGIDLTNVEVFGNGRDGIEGSGVVVLSDIRSYGNAQDGIEVVGGTPTLTLARSTIGVDPSGAAAGNGRGLAGWGNFSLDDVTIANSSDSGIDLSLFAGASLLTTATTLTDNGLGLALRSTAWAAASTTVASVITDCELNGSTVTDNGGNTDSDGTCFPIPNTDPVAVDDAASATIGQLITIDVLANDSDTDGDALVVTAVSSPNASVVPNGSAIQFSAPAGFVGETFDYDISDGNGGAASADVRVELVCPDITLTAADGGSGLAAAVEGADDCPGAQTIFLEPGTYDVRATMFIDDALTVVGADPTNPPVINMVVPSTAWAFYVLPTAGSFAARDIDVIGSNAGAMLYSQGVETTLENVDFRGTSSGCSVVRPSSTTIDGGRFTLINSSLVDSTCRGIQSLANADLIITNSQISGTNGHGIRATGGSVTVNGSQIHGNAGDGIQTSSSPPLLVDDTAIYDNTGDGITGSGSLTVTNSTIGLRPDGGAGTPAGNGGVGVEAFFADLVLTDSVVAHNGAGVHAATNTTVSTEITNTEIRDNVAAGLATGSFTSTVMVTGSSFAGNTPNCLPGFQASVPVDGGGNTDDDGTCEFNTDPEAVDDGAQAEQGETITIDVLANDRDTDGDSITIASADSPNVAIAPDGSSIDFTAPADFAGETFGYTINDGRGGTAGASVTVDVICPDITITEADGGAGLTTAVDAANGCPGPQAITLGPGQYVLDAPLEIGDGLSLVAADPDRRPELALSRPPASPTALLTVLGSTLR